MLCVVIQCVLFDAVYDALHRYGVVRHAGDERHQLIVGSLEVGHKFVQGFRPGFVDGLQVEAVKVCFPRQGGGVPPRDVVGDASDNLSFPGRDVAYYVLDGLWADHAAFVHSIRWD